MDTCKPDYMPGAYDTDNFCFEDFTADYYLSKDDDGVSRLKVEENLVAIFPNYDQNKGICRNIPFTNQDGKNATLRRLTESDITVLRNGQPEPIYSIEKEQGYYRVCTGDDNYILGRQEFKLTYNFERVITDFNDYQELYWDTNGNGWLQKFSNVNARVHFADDSVKNGFTGEKWCYVGKYGEKGSERCAINNIEDGVEFRTKNLTSYENLTFDLEFEPNTFNVPAPEKNYDLIWAMEAIGLIRVAVILMAIRKYIKTTKEKHKYYKEMFVKPEYAPDNNYTLSEMAGVYLEKKKDVKIGVILDMIVKKKINILRKEGKKKDWQIEVVDATLLSEEEEILLKILNGGGVVTSGDMIELKSHESTRSLISLGQKFYNVILKKMKDDKLMESKCSVEKIKSSGLSGTGMGWLCGIMILWFLGGAEMVKAEIMDNAVGIVVGEEYFTLVVASMTAVTAIISIALVRLISKYSVRTKLGLEKARYMDGLKLYITMAEADRIKFLQSVEGAEVTNEGIVKVYEKLLPYAAIFGLEKSWMKELEKYYKIDESLESDWYRSGISTSDLLVATTLMSGRFNTATIPVNTGGGFSSSGFSGGGGGGFSGGGGGGGGGGGR